jgi:hypothetical protein
MERRGFLGLGVSVASLLLLLDGKAIAQVTPSTKNKTDNVPVKVPDKVLEAHTSFVNALAISPDGKVLASGSEDETIKLWSLPDGELLATLEGHKDDVVALAISPDGKILASGDYRGVIILWDLGKRSFRSFLFDPKANETDATRYNVYDKITGRTTTFTLPCDSPIPLGAVCTCNCVSGTYTPSRGGGGGGGTYCRCNSVCTCIPVSDRDAKETFETTNPMTILQRLAEIPIQKWSYKWDDASIRHIGPMAQDFAEAFGVGEDDKHIHPIDAQGVAFSAIQGLYQMLKEKDVQTENLQRQLERQQDENKALKSSFETLERLLNEVVAK